MICETCHGQGLMHPGRLALAQNGGSLLPCEECGGTGYDHCCDPKAYPDMARDLRGPRRPPLPARSSREYP